MISVAMALYNSTRFIEEQLDSIRCQTVPVSEVVMIDDGSSDDTVEWVQRYIDKYDLKNWIIERHQENKGYIATFYDAVERCSGDVIILCDHDDIWCKNKVRLISETFRRKKDILMLATGFEQIDEKGNSIEVKQKRKHANNNLIRRNVHKGALNRMSFYDIAIYNLSPGCTCAISSNIKKDFLAGRCSLPHDWTLAVLAALNEGLFYLDRVTTKYRIYDKNTIGLGHETGYEKRKRIVQNNYLEKRDMLKLVSSYTGDNSKEYNYCAHVLSVFKLRNMAMIKKKPLVAVAALFRSIGLDHLYESVLMDLISFFR